MKNPGAKALKREWVAYAEELEKELAKMEALIKAAEKSQDMRGWALNMYVKRENAERAKAGSSPVDMAALAKAAERWYVAKQKERS